MLSYESTPDGLNLMLKSNETAETRREGQYRKGGEEVVGVEEQIQNFRSEIVTRSKIF